MLFRSLSPTHLLILKARKMPTRVPLNRKSHRPCCSNRLFSSPDDPSRVSGSPGHVHPCWQGHPHRPSPSAAPTPLLFRQGRTWCFALPTLTWTGMAPALLPVPAHPPNLAPGLALRPLSREPREVGKGPAFPQACPPSNSEAPYMSIRTHPRPTTVETVSCCLTHGFAETAKTSRPWRNHGSASACQPPSAVGDGGRRVREARGSAKRVHLGRQERTENEIGENRASGVWPSC